MKKVVTAVEVAEEALRVFGTYTGEKPDLISTGIPQLDNTIGGLTPGTIAILGGQTGLGKSSFILTSMMASTTPVGLISLEDDETILGSRLASYASDVNSMAIRRGTLSPAQVERVRDGVGTLVGSHVHIVCDPGAPLESLEHYMDVMAERGVRLVWVDLIISSPHLHFCFWI